MTTSVIPPDYTVVMDGVIYTNADDWTFSDSDIHAIQWDGVAQSGVIEAANGDNSPVTNFTAEVLPYEEWHARQASLQASLASIDTRFYTVGAINNSDNTYFKTERDLDTCKEEQVNAQYKIASDKLIATDPFLIREGEIGATPAEITQNRADIRTTRDERIAQINAAGNMNGLETLVNGFDEYDVTASGYINKDTGKLVLTQQPVNGTYPWPRIEYTKLRAS